MAAGKTKALTVRLPEELYQAGARTAKRRKVSLNKLMQQSLAAAVRAEEDRELYEAFERFGQDPESSVEYAFEAQREVVLRDEG